MKRINIKKITKFTYFVIVGGLVLVSVLTLLSLFGIPKNAQIYVVETGSMEPEIPAGSLAFISPSSSYSVGDIITYKSNLGKSQAKTFNVTHRVTSVTEDNGDTFYETKGDANTGVDPWSANGLDVLGKVNYHIPYVGSIIGFAKSKLGFVVLILTPAIIIVMLELMNIFKSLKSPKLSTTNAMRSKLYFEL